MDRWMVAVALVATVMGMRYYMVGPYVIKGQALSQRELNEGVWQATFLPPAPVLIWTGAAGSPCSSTRC